MIRNFKLNQLSPNIQQIITLFKTNNKGFVLLILLFALQFSGAYSQVSPNKALTLAQPTANQIAYQQMEMVGFIHFGMNTFSNREWGMGEESPSLFNPSKPDFGQWARIARDAGLKELILTAKHHDGFCLWPSHFTEHCVKNSPWKNGRGDVVREFIDSCRVYGLKVGLYLSPWDRNHKDYGKPAYIEYYKNQLRELLTNYGEINEIWFDGANGGDGYYGGAREKRIIDRSRYYPWAEIFALVKKLQPNILIFSDAGPDIRWIGNEDGTAGDPFWSAINPDSLVIGASNQEYLNHGEAQGKKWIIGQCDVSVRPGWFHHPAENSKVKSPEQLMDIYFKSVGCGAVLLLNIPPDTCGLISTEDASALEGMKIRIDALFENELPCEITESGFPLPDNFSSNQINKDSFPELIIKLSKESEVSLIQLTEEIQFGQRISHFEFDALINQKWQKVAEGNTIGYKRLIPISPVHSSRFRIRISESIAPPLKPDIKLFAP